MTQIKAEEGHLLWSQTLGLKSYLNVSIYLTWFFQIGMKKKNYRAHGASLEILGLELCFLVPAEGARSLWKLGLLWSMLMDTDSII